MLSDKLILTDMDGVTFSWEWMFDIWMGKHGYGKHNHDSYNIADSYCTTEAEADRLCAMFNETVYIRNLPPYLDAIRYMRKLHENHGYVFHAITSISNDPLVIESRVANAHSLFGRSMFYDITCLHPSVSKATVLEQYVSSNCWWIEDHPTNYQIGLDLGLNALLMNQSYNQNVDAGDRRVSSWAEIYKRITS